MTLVLLVALIGVIAFAVTRLPVGAPARPTPVAAQPTSAPAGAPPPVGAPGPASKPRTGATIVPAGTPADAATAQSIRDVIQKLDDAQAQAIATNNPQLMSQTATPEFYAEEVATNQDLVDSGVTEVKMINIEWGDIYVDGNTATATAWETWTTTFDDGTTLQSRDRNVYTLIKDASGTWKVSADEHPDQQQSQ